MGLFTVNAKLFGDVSLKFCLRHLRAVDGALKKGGLGTQQLDDFMIALFRRACSQYQKQTLNEQNFQELMLLFIEIEQENLTTVYMAACDLFDKWNNLAALRTAFYDAVGDVMGYE